jgi:hypothetical protein
MPPIRWHWPSDAIRHTDRERRRHSVVTPQLYNVTSVSQSQGKKF